MADFADPVAVALALADALGEGRVDGIAVDGVAVGDGDGDGVGVVSARAETAAKSEKRSTLSHVNQRLAPESYRIFDDGPTATGVQYVG